MRQRLHPKPALPLRPAECARCCASSEDCPLTGPAVPGRSITVALAGQPNVGKSTIFNLLTGGCEHVGNWPGKTVEKKVGWCRCDGLELSVVDLPGTHSLTANSPEERIARDFIIHQRPDVVVAVVDASSLERSLYLVAELLLLPSPIVVALNMIDIATEAGAAVEPHVLEAALGVPVVPMTASRGVGARALLEAIAALVAKRQAYRPQRPSIGDKHRPVAEELEALIAPAVPEPYPADWVAHKLLEGDEELTAMMGQRLTGEVWQRVQAILHEHEDAIIDIAAGRYAWIGRMVRAATVEPRLGQVTLTDRLDRYATHPLWGLVILGVVLSAVFGLTYRVGAPFQEWLDWLLVQQGGALARQRLAASPAWLQGLVANGIIGGAGTVLTFVPMLALFFACLAMLEEVGYMARAAYVADRFMHRLGLHGRSFVPLCLGFGCNVPAVMATRTIDAVRARLLTILLAPFVPCTARMAVVAVLAPVFFGPRAALVTASLVVGAMLALVAAGVVLSRVVVKGELAPFIMELPLYHRPELRCVARTVRRRTLRFVRKAGGIIVLSSVFVWALLWLPNGDEASSYLARFGRLLAPATSVLGLDWRMVVALLSGFIARENVLATLGVLYSAGETAGGLEAGLRPFVSPASALAFLTVHMLFVPCLPTVATIRQETSSWRWACFAVGLMLAVSVAAGTLVYHAARAFGWSF